MFGCDGRVVYIAVNFNIALYGTSTMLKSTAMYTTLRPFNSFNCFRQQLRHFYCVNIEIDINPNTALAH